MTTEDIGIKDIEEFDSPQEALKACQESSNGAIFAAPKRQSCILYTKSVINFKNLVTSLGINLDESDTLKSEDNNPEVFYAISLLQRQQTIAMLGHPHLQVTNTTKE